MKSVEKPLGTISTKADHVSASRTHSSAAGQSLDGDRQKRKEQSPSSENPRLREAEAVGEATRQASPAKLDKTVSTENETGSPVSTNVDRKRLNPHLVCLLDPRSEYAENYYRLRHQLETRRPSNAALVVGVTSASPGDGKSLTAINLAGALGRGAGTRILLLDLNLRQAGEGVADYLAMDAQKDRGIVDWAQQEGTDFESITHYLEPFNLHVVPVGSDPDHPYELLKSSRLDDLVSALRQDYDFIIIDAPQILGLPDTELIARIVDGFLIVVKAGHTRQARLEEALNLMTEEQVLGLVFNAAPGAA